MENRTDLVNWHNLQKTIKNNGKLSYQKTVQVIDRNGNL